MGTITAIGMSKSKKVIRKSIEQINDFPIMNPEIVTAIGLLMFFSAVAIRKGFVTMLLAHIRFCIPYGVNNISIMVYTMSKRVNPTINAISTLIIVIITVALLLLNIIPFIKERKRKK